MNFLTQISLGKRLLFPILSGILMTISFPETGGIWPLSFIAWIPLLAIENYTVLEKKSAFGLFVSAYITFFVYNVGTTWWVYNASSGGAMMAFFANSLLMALTFFLYHLLKRRLGVKWNGPLLICTWLTFEFFHFNWELSWPWLTYGNVFANVPSLVQWYSITGVLGGSLWVLILNILLYKIFRDGIWKTKLARKYGIVTAFVLFIPMIFSTIQYLSKNTSGNEFHVTIVQPNIDPYHVKFEKSNEQQLQELIQLIDSKINSHTQLIIAPETSLYPIGAIYESNLRKELFNHQIREKRSKWNNAGLLIGASTYNTFPEKNSNASEFNTYYNEWLEQYNSSLLFDNHTEPTIIHKSKLVLGVEKIPFIGIFPWLRDYAVEMEGGSGSLGIENAYRNFSFDSIAFTSDVCYESIYGEFVAKQTKLGSQFIAIITNDGWWKDTPGYRQHFAFARLRAIENNKYVVRSANTGKSGIINNRGDILQETGWWEEAVINGTIQLNTKTTIYQILGDFIGYIACCGLVLFILLRFYKGFHFSQKRK